MRRLVLLTLALPAVALAQPAAEPAPAWEPVPIENDEGTSFAIDRASVAREGTRVTLLTRMQRREPSPSGLYRTITRWRYDCAARTAEVLRYEVFGLRGDVLEAMDLSAGSEVEPVQPETAHDFIMRAVC